MNRQDKDSTVILILQTLNIDTETLSHHSMVIRSIAKVK